MSQEREVKTIQAMVEIYCRAHHGRDRDQLCEACQTLFEYAQARLGKCPFGPEKPVCANCPIHCYRPEMRDQIREVMRYSGPRMALRHPGLALSHLIQKNKPVPERPRAAKRNETDTQVANPECCSSEPAEHHGDLEP